MFLTNIGLNNNPAQSPAELVEFINNAGFEIAESIYAVGEYDNNYEPTFVALLTMENGTKASVCAAMDSLSDQLTQECIPVCFADLQGFMCGQNPKGYEFDRNYMLKINERNKHNPFTFVEYVSEPKVYASHDALLATNEFWVNYFSNEELKPLN